MLIVQFLLDDVKNLILREGIGIKGQRVCKQVRDQGSTAVNKGCAQAVRE